MADSKQPFRVLLSFDLEEFDIPNEFGAALSVEEQLSVGHSGNSRLLPLLETMKIPSTFFTTAFYARQNAEEIKSMAAEHEIASHAFHHSHFEEEDLHRSRQLLAQVSGQAINGFRMPRLAPVEKKALIRAGYTYDASLNPTWMPGRYNHLRKPRTLFSENGIWVMPASVTPQLRIPMFWLAFKNLPLPVLKYCSMRILNADGYISLYFHPWEYADLSEYSQLPGYIRRKHGYELLDKLHAYLDWLADFCEFETIGSFIAGAVQKQKEAFFARQQLA